MSGCKFSQKHTTHLEPISSNESSHHTIAINQLKHLCIDELRFVCKCVFERVGVCINHYWFKVRNFTFLLFLPAASHCWLRLRGTFFSQIWCSQIHTHTKYMYACAFQQSLLKRENGMVLLTCGLNYPGLPSPINLNLVLKETDRERE